MAAKKHVLLHMEQFIKTTPSQVYYALTNATSLQEWFCDMATTQTRIGGRLYFYWTSGFYACGTYCKLEPDKLIEFSYLGKEYPADTRVLLNILDNPGGVKLKLVHSASDNEQRWVNINQEIKKNWKNHFTNLASILETGIDLRLTKKPMLGIIVSDFNEEIAQKLQIPVSKGIRIDSSIDGMGAKAAGLTTNDVIIRLAGEDITGGESLNSILQKFETGDEIEVCFYRNAELLTKSMRLSGRSLPEIPSTALELSEAVSKQIREYMQEFNIILDTLSEEKSDYHPKPGEWCIKDTIAHLIHGERGTLNWISDLLGGQEAHYDNFGGNQLTILQATINAYPTLQELRNELQRNQKEVIFALAALPDEFINRKGTYRRLATALFDGQYHALSHLKQMKEIVDT